MAGLICTLMPACRRNEASIKPLAGPPQLGALYSFNDGEGGFRVGKVLGVGEEAIFVRWYGKRWLTRPTMTLARQASNSVFVAFSMQTFASMQPLFLEKGTVAAEETSEYEVWKQSDQTAY